MEKCLTGATPGCSSWNFCSNFIRRPPLESLMRSWNTAEKGSPCRALRQAVGIRQGTGLQDGIRHNFPYTSLTHKQCAPDFISRTNVSRRFLRADRQVSFIEILRAVQRSAAILGKGIPSRASSHGVPFVTCLGISFVMGSLHSMSIHLQIIWPWHRESGVEQVSTFHLQLGLSSC